MCIRDSQNITRAGDHVVAAKTIYGGTYNLLAHTLPTYGVTATFVDPSYRSSALHSAGMRRAVNAERTARNYDGARPCQLCRQQPTIPQLSLIHI